MYQGSCFLSERGSVPSASTAGYPAECGGCIFAQANAANGPQYLTTPDAGTVFANATLIIDTTNTSQLAVEPEGGTRAGIICAPPQVACHSVNACAEAHCRETLLDTRMWLLSWITQNRPYSYFCGWLFDSWHT